MSVYTFLVRYDEEPAEGVDLQCPSRIAAIKQAGSFLADMLERHPGEFGEASVTVGEGSLFDDDTKWLGQWEWSDPDGVRWEPGSITPPGAAPSRH